MCESKCLLRAAPNVAEAVARSLAASIEAAASKPDSNIDANLSAEIAKNYQTFQSINSFGNNFSKALVVHAGITT